MWFNYKKPRPYRDGAFHFAATNMVPIIPTFTQMINLEGEAGEDGFLPVKHVIHVLPPIYPDPNLSPRENRIRMAKEEREARWKLYEELYDRQADSPFDPILDIAGYHS